MSVRVYLLKHPTLGYFVGYKRTFLWQLFTRKPLWDKVPRFIYDTTFHRTLEDAREFLIDHEEFPPETGIVEFNWE